MDGYRDRQIDRWIYLNLIDRYKDNRYIDNYAAGLLVGQGGGPHAHAGIILLKDLC